MEHSLVKLYKTKIGSFKRISGVIVNHSTDPTTATKYREAEAAKLQF